MPTNTVKTILSRLESLEDKMESHLIESGGIKGDIQWLKRLMIGITGGWSAILVAVFIWSLKRG